MSDGPHCRVYVGTDDGLRTVNLEGESATLIGSTLHGDVVRDVAAHPTDSDRALIACGLGGWGLHRTADAGTTTELLRFGNVHVWGVDRHPDDPEEVYAGTEPPALYQRTGADQGFTSLDGVHNVPSRDEWAFFYEPFEAGHIHGVSVHPARPDRLFAAVEIGGLLRSEDHGETWSDALRGEDFHRTAVSPTDPDRIFATGETGLYESRDGGRSWAVIEETADHYCGDIVFDSEGTAYLTGGEGPGAEESIIWIREEDEWTERVRLPADGVAGRFSLDVIGKSLIHATSADDDNEGGRDRLLVSQDRGHTWSHLNLTIPTVRAVDHVPL